MSASDYVWGESLAADRVWSQVSGICPSKAGRRLLMVLQVFVDDSRDKNNDFLVLAGYIAKAETWAAFSKDWSNLLPWATLDRYNRRRFKMNEMALSTEGMQRFPAFYRIIEKHLRLAVSLSISKRDFELAKKRIWVNRPGFTLSDLKISRLDNFYVFAAASFLTMINKNREMIKLVIPEDDPIDSYFDEQTEKGLLLSAWDYSMGRISDIERRKKFGATPRFEDDVDFLPLQAADLWAWWVRRSIERTFATGEGTIGDFEGKFEPINDGPRIIHLHINEDDIARSFMNAVRSVENQAHIVYNVRMGPTQKEFGFEQFN